MANIGWTIAAVAVFVALVALVWRVRQAIYSSQVEKVFLPRYVKAVQRYGKLLIRYNSESPEARPEFQRFAIDLCFRDLNHQLEEAANHLKPRRSSLERAERLLNDIEANFNELDRVLGTDYHYSPN